MLFLDVFKLIFGNGETGRTNTSDFPFGSFDDRSGLGNGKGKDTSVAFVKDKFDQPYVVTKHQDDGRDMVINTTRLGGLFGFPVPERGHLRVVLIAE